MRQLIIGLILSGILACATSKPPVVIPQPPPTTEVDIVACKAEPVDNYCEGPSGVLFELNLTTNPDTFITQTSDGNGYAFIQNIPSGLTSTYIIVTAPGYQPLILNVDIPSMVLHNHQGKHNMFTMDPNEVDPGNFPLIQLASIKGAMWTARLNLPYGPRPNQDDNILAMDFYQLYDKPTQQRMLAAYKGMGYTHAVSGPISGTDCYHNQYPCHDPSNPGWFPQDGPPSQQQWDFYLARLQEWWNAGIAPIVFIHPDGWTFEQTSAAFTPLLQQPKAQKLIRIIVPAGWEPTRYGWSSCTWAKYFQWARATLPNALVLAHSVNDTDALVGTDNLCDDNGHPNGEGWAREAPYLHGWLIQNGPYDVAPSSNPTLANEFAAQFQPDGNGATFHGIAWHFAHQIASWPGGSAWGPTTRIKLYNAEVTSYNAYWHNLPESISKAWGDLAMQSGADGCLDGCH